MSGQTATADVSDDDIDALLAAHTNWGRWGVDDQRGTLNLVTPQSVIRARDRIREGRTLTLSRAITTEPSAVQARPPLHIMTELHADAGARRRGTASDWLGIAAHGLSVTHVDALCHQSWRGRMYNDHPVHLGTARAGIPVLEIGQMADGLFVPAVLLDLPRALGVAYLQPGQAVGPGDLDRALELSGATFAPGDALLVSTGRERRDAEQGVLDPLVHGSPGLSHESAAWLAQAEPSVVVTDVQCDVMRPGVVPHPMPLHVVCLVGLGVHLVDNARLDRLVDWAQESGPFGFAFSLSPLLIKRGTGSPVAPMVLW